MKRFTATIIFTVLFTNFLFAQDYYGSSYNVKPVSLGITLSPNFNWLRYDNDGDIETSAKIGFAYGLLSDFYLAENYALSTGFLINSINGSSNFPGGNLPQRSYKLQYVEIPFGLKLQSTQRYYKSYYGQFGFTAGMKISGTVKEEEINKKNLGSDADLFRLGLQVGGGINWQLDHKMNLMTGLTFNNGFTQLLKDGEAKNSYVSFNLAIFF